LQLIKLDSGEANIFHLEDLIGNISKAKKAELKEEIGKKRKSR